jgi:hypothetical protein
MPNRAWRAEIFPYPPARTPTPVRIREVITPGRYVTVGAYISKIRAVA